MECGSDGDSVSKNSEELGTVLNKHSYVKNGIIRNV